MKSEKAEAISEALLSLLNKKFSETSDLEGGDSLFSGLSFYRKKRRILSEEEILQFWKRNALRSKAISLCALALPMFAAFLLFRGVLETTTVCWIGLGGLTIYAFYQLFLIDRLERLLGAWKATSLREARKSGEKGWKFVDASDRKFPANSRFDTADGSSN
ncbi:hypothetical protein [Roseibium aggregatum]|uniref:Uncharacterized protein n=1 Tax=Roseibium aggregatum TaxID=187304 RepID=A0A926NTG5_9HYPH|nr:hypothetical protein [Roseibium aggregatum]MBD1547107.1 hypothetical protein [Roseibium aggregatum]